jgi:hypothetical protein
MDFAVFLSPEALNEESGRERPPSNVEWKKGRRPFDYAEGELKASMVPRHLGLPQRHS